MVILGVATAWTAMGHRGASVGNVCDSVNNRLAPLASTNLYLVEPPTRHLQPRLPPRRAAARGNVHRRQVHARAQQQP